MSMIQKLAPSQPARSHRQQQVEVIVAKLKFGFGGVILGAVLATVPDFVPFIPFV